MTLDEAIAKYNKSVNNDRKLKAYQQQHIALCEKYDVNTAEELYVKAIDDFTKELKDYSIIPHDVKVIEMKAIQLKVVE